jgi:hypothetical protein
MYSYLNNARVSNRQQIRYIRSVRDIEPMPAKQSTSVPVEDSCIMFEDDERDYESVRFQ